MSGFQFNHDSQLFVTTDDPDANSTFANGFLFSSEGALHIKDGTPAATDPVLSGIARTHAGACYVTTTEDPVWCNGTFNVSALGQIVLSDEGATSYYLSGIPYTSGGASVVVSESLTDLDFLLLESGGFGPNLLLEAGGRIVLE